MNKIILSREELYKKIWESPIRLVAQELGVSDVGLAKICKRNGIPKPPQGYHLKKPGYVKDSFVRALPPIEAGQLSSFEFNKDSDSPNNELEDEFYLYLAEHKQVLDTKGNKFVNSEVKQIKSYINRNKGR